jgi:hypothetical protein
VRDLTLVVWFSLAAMRGVGQPRPAGDAVDLAQKQVIAYIADLADVRCKETVVQEKFAENGHVLASEHSEFDYFIMMQGDGTDFQLMESRLLSLGGRPKPLPMLVTNGFSTLLLIFHPYYRDSFEFEVGAEESVRGRPSIPVHFRHIAGMRSPAALSLRGREYALELQGTAWVDEQSGHVVSMDASLMKDMSDLGLRSLSVHVDYELTPKGTRLPSAMLPVSAVIDLKTPRQHWRNTHTFWDYGSFTTSAEQGPAQVLAVPKLPSSVAPVIRAPAQTMQVPNLPSSVAPITAPPSQTLQVPTLPPSVAQPTTNGDGNSH